MFDDYIFDSPSFLRGAASAVDLSGSLGRRAFVVSRTRTEADARALASDFRVVNRDLNAALEALEIAPAAVDAEE